MSVDSESFTLFGQKAYSYGLTVAVAALAALFLFREIGKRHGYLAGTTRLFGTMALPLGLICARALFCLLDSRFRGMFSLRAALSFWGGGFSMAGALLGASLAAYWTARIAGIYPADVMDVVAAPLLLFAAIARLGEGYTEVLGRSRPLTTEFLRNSFLAFDTGYGDVMLKTYLLEAATAAFIALALARMATDGGFRRGDAFLTGMLLLGCTQVFWESLRFDSHMRWSFVNMQQVLFACMFVAPMIIWGRRCGKTWLWTTIAVCALAIGGAVGLEFMIDRSGWNRLVLYAAYAVLMAVPAVLGLRMRGRCGT